MSFSIDSSWTLFLDRDGVINKRKFGSYIKQVDEFEFLPHALKGIKHLSSLVDKIIVVTNQQGIAKKEMNTRNLLAIHRYMVDEVTYFGGRIDAVFYADNMKGAELDRRKPNPAMALEAKQQFPNIDFNKSIMVGDTDTDFLFGMNLGMKTIGINSEESLTISPDLMVNDLMELFHYLNERSNG